MKCTTDWRKQHRFGPIIEPDRTVIEAVPGPVGKGPVVPAIQEGLAEHSQRWILPC
jgi:hypothetical protein